MARQVMRPPRLVLRHLLREANRLRAALDLLDHAGGTQRADKAQQLYQPLMTGRSLEPCEQTLRYCLSHYLRHEAFADRLPERGSLEILLPPVAPSLHCARRHRELFRKRVGGETARPREQYERHRDVHPATEKPDRGRGRAAVAPPAGKAQPPGILLAHRNRAAPGFTGKIRNMQRAGALGTTSLPGLGGELDINPGE